MPFDFGNTKSDTRLYTAVDILDIFYERIPENQKYQVVFDVYSNLQTSTHMPKKIILDVMKYRPDDILAPLKEFADERGNLTIYRGTCIKEEKPHLALSWTLKKETAEFFARDYTLSKAIAMVKSKERDFYYIYTGTIHIDDVIYYTNERKEFEIVQHRRVKDISEKKLQREKPLTSIWD